jgi:hypothetical protein
MSATFNVAFVLAHGRQLRYVREMHKSEKNAPIFYYVIEVQGREFPIVVTSDGISHWDDHSGRRAVRAPHQRHLELRAFAGDQGASRQLENETTEFTISIRPSAAIFRRMFKMNRRWSSGEISQESEKDIAKMDYLLRQFFWKEVNPLLTHSLERPI